ncbi:putative monocarboxylate permease [Aspergillus coremiiformis]|uniref:Putative monocarboxylate permease n=1 Tax=Aspergillus coremiiformis TaxID=138285 RepID=A0A5N6YUT2_9EURO|nr:putative monocarboxylate permease [Aspergillus coremiiformis]
MVESTPVKSDTPSPPETASGGWKPDFPDGGLQAWSVAVGAAGLLFCSFGYINSFGVYQEYYQTHQLADKSPEQISWLGSLQVFFLFSGTLLGGPLFDRYGSTIVWPSSLTFVFAVMMTSLCKEYYQFMLAQGLLEGLSSGMIMAPGLAAVSHYFFKNRSTALGIAVGGSSLGGVIFPIALTKMLNHASLGFGWAVRICGFIMLAVLLVSSAVVRPRLPPRRKKIFLPSAFTDAHFTGLIACNFFLSIGLFIPMFYLPSYAMHNHALSTTLSQYLVAILNAASFFGRILLGILADRLGRLNVLCVAALTTAVLCFCWTKATSAAAIIVFAAVYGFTSGAVVSMLSACFAQVPRDPRNIGTYMGMGMFCVAFGALIGTPISGVLVSWHGFWEASVFAGMAILVGGLMVPAVKTLAGKGILSRF